MCVGRSRYDRAVRCRCVACAALVVDSAGRSAGRPSRDTKQHAIRTSPSAERASDPYRAYPCVSPRSSRRLVPVEWWSCMRARALRGEEGTRLRLWPRRPLADAAPTPSDTMTRRHAEATRQARSRWGGLAHLSSLGVLAGWARHPSHRQKQHGVFKTKQTDWRDREEEESQTKHMPNMFNPHIMLVGRSFLTSTFGDESCSLDAGPERLAALERVHRVFATNRSSTPCAAGLRACAQAQAQRARVTISWNISVCVNEVVWN